MIRNFYAISLGLTLGLCAGLSGCTQQKTITAAPPTQPQTPATPTITPLTEDLKARKFLESFLTEITTGGFNGSSYFCKADNSFRFYSPRKYEILRLEPGNENSMIGSVRLESSNAGGVPIIKNWSFFMTPGKPEESSYIKDKEAVEQRYCILLVTD